MMKSKRVQSSEFKVQSLKFKVVALVVVLLIGFSCKTVKQNVVTRADVQATVKNDLEVKTNTVESVTVKDVGNDKIEQTDRLFVNEITVELSKPDSTGKQYPERVTYRETSNIKKGKKESSRIRDSTATIETVQELAEKTDLKSEKTETSEMDTKTKVKPPQSFSWAIILLALGALVFGYLVLRRFKLIK